MIRLPNGYFRAKGRYAERLMDQRSRKNDTDTKKPLGRALDWSDEDLDRIAEVPDSDFDRARGEVTEAMREAVDAEETKE